MSKERKRTPDYIGNDAPDEVAIPLILQRIDGKTRIAENGCFEWLGCTDSCGYGYTWFRKKNWKIHRLVWTIQRGPIPEGMILLHSCDNPPCWNPEHLRLGTDKENIHDCIAKNRGHVGKIRGSKNHCKQGHEYTPENTRWDLHKSGTMRRACRRCQRICIRKKAGWPEWAWDLPPTPLGQRPFNMRSPYGRESKLDSA